MANTRTQHLSAFLFLCFAVCIMGCAGCGGVKDSNTQSIEPQQEVNNDTAESVPKSASTHKSAVAGNKSNDSYKIQLLGEENNPMRYPHIIQFTNGKVVDITEVDPYKDLAYPVLRQQNGGLNRLYDLVNLTKPEVESLLKEAHINEEAFHQMGFFRMFNKLPVVEAKEDKVAIAYHATYYSSEEDILSTQGYALIYDNEGNLIQKIEDREHGFYDIRLSADGQYLMQKYGTAYGEDGGGRLNMGFKFYDTDTGEMIFEWDLGRDQFISSYGSNGAKNLLKGFHVVRDDPKRFEWFYIFPELGHIYVKYIPRHPIESLDKEMNLLYNDLMKEASESNKNSILKDHGFNKMN